MTMIKEDFRDGVLVSHPKIFPLVCWLAKSNAVWIIDNRFRIHKWPAEEKMKKQLKNVNDY